MMNPFRKTKTLACTYLTIMGSLLMSFHAFAQTKEDSVLMTIGGEKVTVSEVMSLYRKNSIKGTVLNKKSFEEYLELFLNYKLKIRQANDLKMDTALAFKNEFQYYRSQLAQPYMTDEEMSNLLTREAYQRKLKDVRASHILVKLDINASPEDTLAAYNKIVSIRERILKGEDFGKVAAEVSDDISARDQKDGTKIIPGNKGDLGYFTVFDMVYPFETAAYNTGVGKVSIPVRTDFGYHLVKVTNIKPAIGEVLASHILFQFDNEPSHADSLAVKIRVDSIFAKVKKGEDFAMLARNFSDDRITAPKGGLLPWFGSNRMVPEIIEAVDGLKPGQYSQPFLSSYGWHILKVIERKPIGNYEDIKDVLRQKVTRGDRLEALNQSFVEKLKKSYGYKADLKALDKVAAALNDSVFAGKWKIPSPKKLTKYLFSFDGKTYTQLDLANYIETTQTPKNKFDKKQYASIRFNSFVNKELLDYEDKHLEIKYPEFRDLLQEYHDGLLVYALTDMNVWSRADADTTGLRLFYEQNKNNYMGEARLDASVFTVFNSTRIDKVRGMVLKGSSEEEILKSYNSDTTKVVTIEHHQYLRGESPLIDLIDWKEGLSRNVDTDGTTTFVMVHNVIPPMPKALKDIRGTVVADYQNYLEKSWMNGLRKKYPCYINKDVLALIQKDLK
ncbi:MAG: peptidylprolyl isomerase [Bacteroidota bacterium]|nr:peptidylprolyl isomerase [Bacteroidota bacterium]